MLPLYRKVTIPSNVSFSTFLEQPPAFETPWHYHPEYELILISNCNGMRYVGDHMAEFGTLELLLIGPNLPHYWQEDKDRISHPLDQAYVTHFSEEVVKPLLHLPESYQLQILLDDARCGLWFNDPSELLIRELQQLFELKEFERYLLLIKLLHQLSRQKYERLSSPGLSELYQSRQRSRLDKVMQFTMENFRQKIQLEEVAGRINMTRNAFCRYFKQHTGKTYSQFLKEVRIGWACRQLQKAEGNIAAISYECGYDTLSHFNRQFRSVMRLTPSEYRQRFSL